MVPATSGYCEERLAHGKHYASVGSYYYCHFHLVLRRKLESGQSLGPFGFAGPFLYLKILKNDGL